MEAFTGIGLGVLGFFLTPAIGVFKNAALAKQPGEWHLDCEPGHLDVSESVHLASEKEMKLN